MAQGQNHQGGFVRGVQKILRSLVEKISPWLNFYRIHMLYFIFMGFFWSAIIYASNPKDHYVPYIDCLFLAVSALCVTGLTSYPASQMTLWQQIILFCLMICGNLIIVSTSTVLNRRHIISKYMHKELKKSKTMKMIAEDIEEKEKQQSHVRRWFGMHAQNKDDLESTRLGNTTGFEKSAHTRIHTGMIQRVDGPAIHINPTGQQTTVVGTQEDMSDPTSGASEPAKPIAASSVDNRLAEGPLHNISHHDSLTHSSAPGPRHLHENGLGFTETPNDRMNDQVFSERPILTSQTEIQNGVSDHYDMEEPDAEKNEEVQGLRRRHRKGWRRSLQKLPRDTLNRTMTKNMESGIGQFPSIFDLISTLMDMTRTKKKFTIPRVRTMATTHTMQELGPTEEVRMAPYLSFDAIVTGNSHFHGLTKAQRS